MLNGLLFKKTKFNTLMLIPMMMIMTLRLAVVFNMTLLFRIMIAVLSHKYSFKYKNMMYNPSNVTTTHLDPYLVDYLTSLNECFWPPLSMIVWPCMALSKIIINHLSLQWMFVSITNLLKRIISILKHQPLMVIIRAPSYFLE